VLILSLTTSEPSEEMESNWDEVIESFDELGLKKDLLRGKPTSKSRHIWVRL
jgi:hypothetical protein